MIGLGLLLLFAAPAHAVDFYIEGPSVTTRAEAVAMVQTAKAAGHKARVVRRYRHGSGWEYVFRVEGFTERLGASQAASQLAELTGRGVSVYGEDGTIAAPSERPKVDNDPAPVPIARVEPSEQAEPLDAPQVPDELIQRATRAHGGADGTMSVLGRADVVVFEFDRHLDGDVVRHIWARRGDDLFLEVRSQAAAVPSRTVIQGDTAWLVVGDGERVSVDTERARQTVERFAPETVIGLGLTAARDFTERPELHSLRLDGETTCGDDPCAVMRFDGGRLASPVVLGVATSDWTVRQVGFRGGVMREFEGYTEPAPGLVVPGVVRTWRHRELVDDLRITRLDPQPELPDDWFDAALEGTSSE